MSLKMGNVRLNFATDTKIEGVLASDGLEEVNTNQDYKYKLPNIGLGSAGAPHGPSKGQKIPKLEKLA
jgi:hypothetical protein